MQLYVLLDDRVVYLVTDDRSAAEEFASLGEFGMRVVELEMNDFSLYNEVFEDVEEAEEVDVPPVSWDVVEDANRTR